MVSKEVGLKSTYTVKVWIKALMRTRKRRQMQALMRRMFEGSAQAEQ